MNMSNVVDCLDMGHNAPEDSLTYWEVLLEVFNFEQGVSQ